jgi:Family of unknown function (DUF5681)
MPNPENIEKHKFEPGKSGNPAGRPPGIPNTKTRLLRLLTLEQEITNPVNGKKEMFTVAEQMDLAMINKARKGDTRAYQALVDRLEGKPQQYTDLTTDGEKLPPMVIYRPEKLPDDTNNTEA